MPKAQQIGVVDAAAQKDVLEEAAAFALAKKPNPISKRPIPDANKFMVVAGGLEQGELMAWKAAPAMNAPGAIIRCLRAAASKSWEEGCEVEAREFTTLLFSVQSAALRHLFFAERMALKLPGVEAAPKPLKKV